MACSRRAFSPSMVALSSMGGPFLVVVAGAAHVGVRGMGREFGRVAGQGLAGQAGAQDRLDAAVGVRAQGQRAGAGGLGPAAAAAAGPPEEAQRRPGGLLWG